MSDIEERIAAVLENHSALDYHRACYCGQWRDSGPGDNRRRHNYEEHVAAEVVRELGLTQESQLLSDGMGGCSYDTRTGAVTHYSRPQTRQSRYVTAWKSDPAVGEGTT